MMTVPEYARSRHVCAEHIWRMARTNQIPHYRFGRAVRLDPVEVDRVFHRAQIPQTTRSETGGIQATSSPDVKPDDKNPEVRARLGQTSV